MRGFSYLNRLKIPRKHLLSLQLLRNERGLLASMAFNNMMHAMHEYSSKIIYYYKREALYINFLGKKERKKRRREKK